MWKSFSATTPPNFFGHVVEDHLGHSYLLDL